MKKILLALTMALVASTTVAHAEGEGSGFGNFENTAPASNVTIPAHPGGCTGWDGTRLYYWSYSAAFGWSCQSYEPTNGGGGN